MSTYPKPPTQSPTAEPDPDTLRQEIAETRADLGDTVDALAAKADVPGRAKTALAERRQTATATAGRVTGQVREKAAPVVAQAREKAGPAVAQARVYAVKARDAAAKTSPRTRIGAGGAAGAVLVVALVAAGVRRSRRRAAAARWYRRVGRR
jgi:hypothetical protein